MIRCGRLSCQVTGVANGKRRPSLQKLSCGDEPATTKERMKSTYQLLQDFSDNAMGHFLQHRYEKALKLKVTLSHILKPQEVYEIHDAWIHLVAQANPDREGFCRTIKSLREKYER
jgi:hypothetical protein